MCTSGMSQEQASIIITNSVRMTVSKLTIATTELPSIDSQAESDYRFYHKFTLVQKRLFTVFAKER